MSHYVLGTAGHIDHGKTALTKALTGVDTDRLKEEKERRISIEPGFAPFRLPSGQKVSIVDVPGHERFIRQMVSGVAGIDLVLLVVAADEGVMPQTREHLHIIELLNIRTGVIVLTKMDVADPELIPLIEEDLRMLTKNTALEGAPICRVSARTGEGLDELVQTLDRLVSSLPPRQSEAPFRLPIDRVFTIRGAGTVVTGTVQSGSARTGDELEILPGNLRVRVRQIQVHGETVPRATAGQRAAFNLSAADADRLYRGQTLTEAGAWSVTDRLDARVKSLPDLDFTLKHRALLKLLIGTAETMAELILYDRKEWEPGEDTFVTLRLREPVVAGRGDRFILRRPSPAATIGGGEVIDPYPPKHKIRPESALWIAQRLSAGLEDRILEALKDRLFMSPSELARHLTEPEKAVSGALNNMEKEGRVVSFFDRVASTRHLQERENRVIQWLDRYHREYPMREGAPKAEVISRLLEGITAREASRLMDFWSERGSLRQDGENLSLPSFTPHIPDRWSEKANRLLGRLKEEGISPPNWKALLEEAGIPPEVGKELRPYWIREGTVIPLTDEILLHHDAFSAAVEQVVEAIRREGPQSISDLRKRLPVSRKYLIPLLETMDQRGITRRRGDVRELVDA
ncbi:selenocysteine-specific translation elongation factor SelB [Planifilum fulgidum]|uniref:Selenocysteine-specific elongation factor n=1 Tax=Planifilum fulgidum TaxID=201973 RepID=A0A1I2KJG2_9BACL|nr:selenocysteine-specific translation elongation factor [Planifilum fulgidum]SFF67152.1 selenocysteine-specific translation elongation factor SelB [Planifilum fulgidum]